MNFEEALALGGRVNDPSRAPMVPVYTEINSDSGYTDVTIHAWNRSRDVIVVMRFTVETEGLEITEQPVSSQDAEWLLNIGART